MYEWEGASVVIFVIFGHLHWGLFFKLQQHNVPEKITFFMNIYDYENENIV